ncbi:MULTISPECIES: cytochrome c biogenesis CcdA family protein [Agreia]|uniref:cytochrome c biogenesis CcdA family protein n=1 Tax=Agreia TaxID=110934 RepID=UPI00070131D7|nr:MULTISPECIES: cytochrome c biogenesis protein CcdA [Microbacteriaceae]KQM60923.1 cytochrome C biogenesis protein [Agreia sp. Leaf210]KQR23935.1 cytochrome C biogenesis protein [Agreia sp. Leaf335]MBF4632938.1 cytochrome c biogenesis protein CcdA [Agreia pratensis]PPF62223.1 cytochrome C biogenesis protein [Clavibacter michiganensis]
MNNPFAEAVLSGQLLLALPIALLAGLVSFASPCVLPLVPGYLGYIGGFASAPDATGRARGRGRLLLGVALFVLGFSLVFVAYGAAFGAVGAWLTTWQDLITRILGVVVIVLGLVFIGQFTFMQRTFKPSWAPATGLAGAPLLGIVFGLGWTPCIGPTLSAIAALSLNGASPWRGALLGLVYCIGLGIPFFLVALGFNWVTGSVAFLKRHIRAVNIIGGALLIAVGLLMVSGIWTIVMNNLQGVMFSFVSPV